ncbi:ribonuclease P/MRP protein subunit POP5 [Blastomyces silverae]|uniref:Ribonuclease P/MRP protein subunit POP5 n=1 Tax=Blastomyces silverae TaxID=2060906 RepID=A0A0H1B872_9EURO|nr:ribonuclease P/MRP protein subunit POP5 [Blastomyces silverae]
MVRFKHRYLLIDILYPPASHSDSIGGAAASTTAISKHTHTIPNNAKDIHLLIHRPTTDTLTPQSLARSVREHVAEMFGDWGMGRLGGSGAGGISVKYLSPATSTAIIRCPRASYRLVWSALTYMSRIPPASSRSGKPAVMQPDCVFRVVRVSGTMRKAEEEAIARARREVVRMRMRGEEAVGGGVLEGRFGGETGEVDVDVDVDVEMRLDDEDEEEGGGSEED